MSLLALFDRQCLRVVCFVLLCPMWGCVSFRMSEREVRRVFAEYDEKPSMHKIRANGRLLHYAEIGDISCPTLFFVHGSPGSWSTYIDYFQDSTLVSHFHMISVDRPGYGLSNFGNPVLSLRYEAWLLSKVVQHSCPQKKVLVVGHSYGGGLAARFVADFPHLSQGLLLLAPTLDPALEQKNWYNYVAKWDLIRGLLPEAIYSCNEEMYVLDRELAEISDSLWHSIRTPTYYIHGTKDRFVSFDNVFYAQKKLTNARLKVQVLEGVDHFIPWTHPEEVVKAFYHLQAKASE